MQKRQCAGDRRERAAAILASMLSLMSSSVTGTLRVESLGVGEMVGSVDGDGGSTGALGTSSSWGTG